MDNKRFKQCLAYILVSIMTFSFSISSAFAKDGVLLEQPTSDEDVLLEMQDVSEEISEDTPEKEIIDNEVEKLQNRVDAVINTFCITSEMTEDEIANAVIEADGDTIYNAMTEREAIDIDAMSLSEEQVDKLELDLYEEFWNIFDLMFSAVPMVAVTGVSGVDVTVDANGSISESGGTVTATVKGSFTTRKTTTITVENTSGSTATISFDYSVSNHDSSVSTIDDLSETNNGSYSVLLTAGATKTFTMCSQRFTANTTATATLKNFKVEAAAAESNVTVYYNNELGSVKIDGTNVANGSVNSISSATGATFVATPKSDAVFVGWIDPNNNKVLYSSASYPLIPTEDVAIKAVFTKASMSPCFWASNKEYLFEDFNVAINHARTASSKTIVLASNGTFSQGNYNIPTGTTLLIPYDKSNTLCTTEPTSHDNAYTKPTEYRTLTMASGARITVDGVLSISGSQSSKYGNNGQPSGPLGFIKMSAESSITINNAGKLYAWGYITGSGSVEVKTGGEVYECFQIADYRGGDATTKIVNQDDKYGVFPFNQYYVQNIEVPMTLNAGSIEWGFSAIYVTLGGTQKLKVPFFGTTDSMFTISSGYVVKDYMEGTGRTSIKVHGNISVTEIKMGMKVSLIGSIEIDSSKYALPIPNHMTVSVESGKIELNQNVEFLPGSELYIRPNAKCVLGTGKSIYIYDWDNWIYNNGTNGYAGTTNLPYVNLTYVPGGGGTTGRSKDALVQVDGIIDVSAGNAYVTAGGANIYSKGTGVIKVANVTETTAYQVITNNTDVGSWPIINMKPLVLKDIEGIDITNIDNIVQTSGYGAGTYTYYANTQKWCPPGHRNVEAGVQEPTCTEGGYTEHICIACEAVSKDNLTEAKGHTEVIDAAVAATCTSTGLTEGSHCSVCGEVLKAQKVIPMIDHLYDGDICSVCKGVKPAVVQVGRTLRYEDKISIIYIFDVSSSAYNEKKDAGLLVWTQDYYKAANGNYSIDTASSKYSGMKKYNWDNNTSNTYYYAETPGIQADQLEEICYYAGYIQKSDGTYIISEVTQYSPADYAYSMIGKYKEDGSGTRLETYNLCIALLNYISAGQQYFGSINNEAVGDLVNSKLAPELREMEHSWTEENYPTLNLIAENDGMERVTEVAPSSIFTDAGGNLLFGDMISIAALYTIKLEPDSLAKIIPDNTDVCGTILWTEDEWLDENFTGPISLKNDKSNIGAGDKIFFFEEYPGLENTWYSLTPKMAPKEMADTKYYFLGYVIEEAKDEEGNATQVIHYSDVKAYTVEEYIYNTVNSKDASTEMKELAKRLYYYERAAKAALPGQS